MSNRKCSKFIIVASAALSCAALFGAEAAKPAATQTQAATPQRPAFHFEWVERPNTQKGCIVFADAQGSVSLGEGVSNVIKKLTLRHRYDMRYVKCAPSVDVAAMKTALKADVLVALVDDATTPTALIALEDHWGVVNVGKVAATLKTPAAREKYLAGRCVKEALRVFSILAGGGASQYPGNIFNCARLDLLDVTDGMFPVDMQKKYHDYLTAIGVTPKVRVSYERACQEGWAPAPTNDVQKTIWEKVHEIPKKPIKIEFDPKRDR